MCSWQYPLPWYVTKCMQVYLPDAGTVQHRDICDGRRLGAVQAATCLTQTMKKLRICVWVNGNVFLTVVLLFLVSLCFQSISRVDGEPYSDSEIQPSQLDSVRQTLQNIIQSFSSDPLTRIGDIETELETQENVLHQIRTEVEELTEFVHSSDQTVARRSLKSTGAEPGGGDHEVPCLHSPYLRGALVVNQVIQTQMCYAMYLIVFRIQ